jgi:FixJ family two-component response regulator
VLDAYSYLQVRRRSSIAVAWCVAYCASMAEYLPLIAVVDDDYSVCRTLVRLLRASRFDAQSFASGQEFLDSLSSHTPCCVLLDVDMPGCDGHAVQRQMTLRQIKLPAIIITACDDPAVRVRCLAAGAVACLSKPLQPEALLTAINAALSR